MSLQLEIEKNKKKYNSLVHNFKDVISSLAEKIDVLLYLETKIKRRKTINRSAQKTA